jgi:hypothetical protein
MATGKKAFVVTVSGNRPIADVKRDLSASGLEVEQVLDSIGSITGRAHPSAVRKLRSVMGVADVSEDHSVSIGPPDAPIS